MSQQAESDGSITVHSPAKLNLFLHITGRRANGYHDLQTVFQLIDLADIITFNCNESGEIKISTRAGPGTQLDPELSNLAPEDNLIFKAANALRQRAGDTKKGANIVIEKRIPVGGGVGGGSSNAATTLLVLNHLWQTQCSIEELAELGLELGADVPIFVRGNSAWAEGVGDLINPVQLEPKIYLVIAPNCHVSTAKIFTDKELTRNTSAIKLAAFLAGANVHNDCEPVVRKHYPEVDQALSWLCQFGNSRMTGTGACIFLELENSPSGSQLAEEICRQVPSQWQAFTTRSLQRSPVHEQLGISDQH